LGEDSQHPDAETVKAKALMTISQHKTDDSVLAKQLERADTMQMGMRFTHDIHGPGVVTETLPDGKRRIQFDNGASHAYKPGSTHKQLKPLVDDAHTFTPAMLFKMVDTDNSGHLNLDEFKTLHEIIVKDEQARAANMKGLSEAAEKQKNEIKRLRRIVLAAFVFCCVFLGIIGGMTVAVVNGFKDVEREVMVETHVSGDGKTETTKKSVLSDRSGNVMETSPAVVALPMSVAPVLSISQLSSLSRLTFSFNDTEIGPTYLKELKVIEDVRSVVSVSKTCIYFKTSGATADEVHVCNGKAYAVVPIYQKYEAGISARVRTGVLKKVDICFAAVECSALRIDDAANADDLIAKANNALIDGNFSTSMTQRDRSRRLGEVSRCMTCENKRRKKAAGGYYTDQSVTQIGYGRSLKTTTTAGGGSQEECDFSQNNPHAEKGKCEDGTPLDPQLLEKYDDGTSKVCDCVKINFCSEKMAGTAGYGTGYGATRQNSRALVADDYTTIHRPRFDELQEELAKADAGAIRTVDLVVARYKEDSSWLADVERELPMVRIFVYEKGGGETICHIMRLKSATCVPLANVGREQHSFMTHLVEHHDHLSDKVVFAQAGPPGNGFNSGQEGGHLMPGSDFFYDYLSPLKPPRMVFTMAYANLASREFLIRRNGYPINEPHAVATVTAVPSVCSGDWLTINNSSSRFWDALHPPKPEIDLPNQLAYWHAHLEPQLGPMTDAFMPFANGAVASASGAQLAARPKAFYEQLRRTVSTGDTPDAIFFLELTWAYIMGHADAAHACARQITAHVEAGSSSAVQQF
jgi:hypothetical protein